MAKYCTVNAHHMAMLCELTHAFKLGLTFCTFTLMCDHFQFTIQWLKWHTSVCLYVRNGPANIIKH